MRRKEELIQLAYLLKLSAQTAREIGLSRPADFPEISTLAHEAYEIAEALEAIANRMHRSN